MAQLLVIDTSTMGVTAYDGKTLIDQAVIGIDSETTPEGLKEVLEDFRSTSSIQSKQSRDQAEHNRKVLNERFQYADKEVKSWTGS